MICKRKNREKIEDSKGVIRSWKLKKVISYHI